MLRRLGLISMGLGLSGCGLFGSTSPAPSPKLAGDPTALSRCKVAANASSPLVTEWPASEKAHLESLLARGAVAVEYSGCELKLVDACRVSGSYAFQRTTLATDTVEVSDADELWAKLPIGAAALEGELARSGRLAVRTTVAGQLALSGFDARALPQSEACAGVSHVIGAISVGAFSLLSGGATAAAGGGSVLGVGAGAKSSRQEQVMRTAGDPNRCAEAPDEAPHRDCASPIQLFLQPVGSNPNVPAVTSSRPLPPSAGVEIAFPAPDDTSQHWSLHDADGMRLCSLPCSRVVPKASGYYLENDSAGDVSRLEIPPRLAFEPGSHAVATYRAERGEPFLSKLTFYGLGIPAAIGGTATLVLGIVATNSDDPRESDRATFWFIGTGMYWGVAAASFWWFSWSHDARLEVTAPGAQAKALAPELRFGPGFVSGTF
jgi:hypothetical protein